MSEKILTDIKIVVVITRDPDNADAGESVEVTYDTKAPAILVNGTPFPRELRLFGQLIQGVEFFYRQTPFDVVRRDGPKEKA